MVEVMPHLSRTCHGAFQGHGCLLKRNVSLCINLHSVLQSEQSSNNQFCVTRGMLAFNYAEVLFCDDVVSHLFRP